MGTYAIPVVTALTGLPEFLTALLVRLPLTGVAIKDASTLGPTATVAFLGRHCGLQKILGNPEAFAAPAIETVGT